ncbi:MAG: formimidoylglutamate deiminase [Acidobacteriota bacterium]
MPRFRCAHLFTGHRWLEDAILEVDDDGTVAAVGPRGQAAEAQPLGVVVPGVPNLHSHAHQRAMAGLAERTGPRGRGSFWTWRELMYRHLEAMTPDDLEAIAAQLYVEMLEAGFTAVGEFQYLHHGPGGQPYEDPAEMTLRCLAAARAVGMGFTALPVLYAHGGFGGRPAGEGQRRFLCDLDLFHRIVDRLRTEIRPGAEGIGVAPHSLRAVTGEHLSRLLEDIDSDLPIHLHIAEQVREVEDCLAWSGTRPLRWLLDHVGVDRRWCLIHATHLDDGELADLATSGAVAGLCPVTEANLGDGLFRAAEFTAAGGGFGIGSDSHISVSPVEELRWLEYGQRLTSLGRNVLAGGPGRSTGRRLLAAALEGGAQACGRPIGTLEVGRRGDWLVLDDLHPLLACRRGDELLDSWIFSGNAPCVREVWVGGRRVVADGRHRDRGPVAARFLETLRRLRAELP